MVGLWPLLLLYGLACVAYLAYLLSPSAPLARIARWIFLGGLLAHAYGIGARCIQGIHPVATPAEALSFIGWLLGLGYWIASFRFPIAVVGAFVGPVSLVCVVLARLTPGPGGAGVPAPRGVGMLGRIHITLSTVGVALFILAAAAASFYLLREAQLKSKRHGLLFHRGPPLATLDAVAHLCVTVGFPVFTVAIVTGALWVAQLSHAAGLTLRPEYSLSMLAWLAFGSLLVARMTAGWQGRRAAWLTLAGFGGTLAVLALYLIRYAAGS